MTWLQNVWQRGRPTTVGPTLYRTTRRGLVLSKLAASVGVAMRRTAKRPVYARDVLWETRVVPKPFKETTRWWVVAFMDDCRYSGWMHPGVEVRRPLDTLMTYVGRKKMMQVRVPEELHRWLKGYAAQHGTSMTEVVVTYLESLKHKEDTISVKQL